MFRAGPPPSPPPPPAVELGGGAFGFGAVPRMKFMSDNCGLLTSPISVIPVFEKIYMMPVSGSYEPPCQLAPPVVDGSISIARGPSHLLTTGGVKIGPSLYSEVNFTASARSAGVKSIRSSIETPWRSKAGGLVGNGCVAEYHSPGTSPLGTARSSIGQIGRPVARSKT